MAESNQHLELVKRIRDLVKARNDVDPNLVVAEDHENNTVTISTPEGYRPDVFYHDNKTLIIGEAKTANDFFNGHSKAQFDSYFNYCKIAPDISKAIIYVGVPWEESRSVKHYFKKNKPASIEIIIVADFGYKGHYHEEKV